MARSLLLFVAAIAILILLHVAKAPAEGLWQQSFLNSLHVFVFAVVAVLLFAATKVLANLSIARRALATLVAAFLLGLVSEAAQISGPRDASLEDLFSDWFGATGALLVAIALMPTLRAKRRSRLLMSFSGLAILTFALFPLLKISAAYAERHIQKPVLVSFDSFFSRTFVRPQHSTLAIIESPSGDGNIGRITLTDGAWPGLIFHDIWPDWRPYSELVIDLQLGTQAPSEIHFRVHDQLHQVGEQPYSDRFNLTRELQPGPHTLRIPLETIRHAPTGRQMDLSKIHGIVIFCSAKDAGRKFDLINIRLE